MATWITHLRIAEKLLKHYHFDQRMFVVGNIAPDGGVPNKNWSEFNPPKKVTHFENDRLGIDYEEFYKQYIKISTDLLPDNLESSFLYGYYAHLIADDQWSKLHKSIRLEKPEYSKRFTEEPGFIWEVKKDWYGLDYKYVKNTAGNIFDCCFMQIDNVPEYLDFFPQGALMSQIRYIQNFYKNENEWVNTEFTYFTQRQMDDFIDTASDFISKTLRTKFECSNEQQL